MLTVFIGPFRPVVNRPLLVSFGPFGYTFAGMTRTFRDLMDLRAFDVAALAKRSGVSERQLRKMIAGEVANPRMPNLVGLAKALRVEIPEVRAAIAASVAAAGK